MDLDDPPLQQTGRAQVNESRIRTPLPTGPRPDKPPPATPLAGVESLKNSELQATASRILLHSSRSRYSTVSALLLHWQDDEDHGARSATEELGNVLQQYYNYTFRTKSIPASDGSKNSWRWLSGVVRDFTENQDQRDVLKIVYYSGHSYLDANREMVLARLVPHSFLRFTSGLTRSLVPSIPSLPWLSDGAASSRFWSTPPPTRSSSWTRHTIHRRNWSGRKGSSS